jgi:hypothetical protein
MVDTLFIIIHIHCGTFREIYIKHKGVSVIMETKKNG